MEDTTGDLRQATRMALFHGGTKVLREPRRFVGLVSDKLGASAPEVRVLYHTVDIGYLERFADAADAGTPTALRDAAERAAAQLEDELAMRTDAARSISLAIALAVSDFLGIDAPSMPPGWEGGENRRRKEEEESRRKAEEDRRRKEDEARIRAEEETRRKVEQAPSVELATVSGMDPTYAYTGRPIEPEPRVECQGRVLARGTDYLLQYHDNVGSESGTTQGSVLIVGIGGYKGSKLVTFDIVAKSSRKPAILAAVAAIVVVVILVVAFCTPKVIVDPPSEPPDNSSQPADAKTEAKDLEADDLEVPQLSLGLDQHETQQVSWGPTIGFKVGDRGFNISDKSGFWIATLYLDDDHTYNSVKPKADETDMYIPLALGSIHIESPRITLWNRNEVTGKTESSWKEEQQKRSGWEHYSHFNQRQLASQDVSGKTLHVYVATCQYHPSVGGEDDGTYISDYYAVLETDDNLLVIEIGIVNDVEQLQYVDGESLFRDFLDGMTLTGL